MISTYHSARRTLGCLLLSDPRSSSREQDIRSLGLGGSKLIRFTATVEAKRFFKILVGAVVGHERFSFGRPGMWNFFIFGKHVWILRGISCLNVSKMLLEEVRFEF